MRFDYNMLLHPLPEIWTEYTKSELKDAKGELHAVGQPAFLAGRVRAYNHGEQKKVYVDSHTEHWKIHGVFHRDGDLPSKIEQRSYGNTKLFTIEYHKDGKLHRDNGPARIEVTAHGKLVKVEYYQNGQLHRDNGPAVIRYNYVAAQQADRYNYITQTTGVITNPVTSVAYYQHGKLHREIGPAKVEHIDQDTGIPRHIVYYRHGVQHNPLGASSVWQDPRHDRLETYTNEQGQKVKQVTLYQAA